MNSVDKIIVALDVQDSQKLDHLCSALQGQARWVKIGMELFYSQGPEVVSKLKSLGFSIFLDLKIHDIPNTAKMASKAISKLGVDMINCHCAGGLEMMKAFREGAQDGALLIGVTQLTSSDQEMLKNELAINKSLEETVTLYAENAKKAGLDGVVASALEVPLIKKSCGEKFLTVTPGIRPESHSKNDQKRVTTPSEALNKLGSDYIVIGRAITQAKDPEVAFKTIVDEVDHGK